jgi:DNA-directed RNA polymerase II subunit RPB7
MFYVKHFVDKLSLHPQYLGQNIQSFIHEYLHKKVEGTCTSFGYIVSVLGIVGISEGKILLSGHVSFDVEYRAVVLKPENGEVIDAPIVSSTEMGYFASVGPLSIFISNYQIPNTILEEIGDNSIVRLKIIGTKIDSSKVYAIGTLNDDFLGVIQ